MLALLFVTLPFVVRSVQPVLLELDREMEEAAASLGASALDDLPADHPAEPRAGDRLAARAGLRARRRRVRLDRPDLRATSRSRRRSSSVYVYKQIESDAPISAAAVSVVLLLVSLVVLLGIRALGRWGAPP